MADSTNSQHSVTAFPPRGNTSYVNLSFHKDHGVAWAAENLPAEVAQALADAVAGKKTQLHVHEYDGPAPSTGKTSETLEKVIGLVGDVASTVGKLVEAQPASVKKRMAEAAE